jgi:hypothetical protein
LNNAEFFRRCRRGDSGGAFRKPKIKMNPHKRCRQR